MLSVLIPANNEEAQITACLQAVMVSELLTGVERPEIIVMANGCTDSTVAIAHDLVDRADANGWDLRVLDIPDGGKLNALNQGDNAASFGSRVYLDADVTVTPLLIGQLAAVLDQAAPIYASGTLVISDCTTWISRAYRRIYVQVPFITHGVPGCGLFAVNAAGRKRWGAFPDIISDDTFVRLQFAGNERVAVAARYKWPIVEGFANLVKVRRRQDKGVAEIAKLYPELLENDDKPRFGLNRALKMACCDPIGFSVYTAVALATRLNRNTDDWSRGR